MITPTERRELEAVVADLAYIADNMMPADSSRDAVLRNVERVRIVLKTEPTGVTIAPAQRVRE